VYALTLPPATQNVATSPSIPILTIGDTIRARRLICRNEATIRAKKPTKVEKATSCLKQALSEEEDCFCHQMFRKTECMRRVAALMIWRWVSLSLMDGR